MSNLRIYFFADFGDMSKPPRGGGEAGNRKTLDLLLKSDFDVVPIPKYIHDSSSSIFKFVRLAYRILHCTFRYILILMFGRRKLSIVHISGFYGNIIYYEWFLVNIAKILGYRVVYEMRGGGAEDYFKNFGRLYRYFFSRTIKRSDEIFTQGIENNSLIRKCDEKVRIYYYPNYVMEGFYPTTFPQKRLDEINIIYFGRISKAKNLDVIVDAFVRLSSKITNLHFYVIGKAEERQYYSSLIDKIDNSGLRGRIEVKGAYTHDELKGYLSKMHFFIFPSSLHREGHSNALTEAMSWGVIPVVSKQGFNCSVVGNDVFVLDEISAKSIADKVYYIIKNNMFENLSKFVYDRAMTLYTEKQAAVYLKKEYLEIFTLFFK